MILFDEMNLEKPIKIFNNYASYRKLSKFTKVISTKSIYLKGKSKHIKLNGSKPLDNEILDFINDKIYFDLNFSSILLNC